jgi:hypothetical protein
MHCAEKRAEVIGVGVAVEQNREHTSHIV